MTLSNYMALSGLTNIVARVQISYCRTGFDWEYLLNAKCECF